MKSLKFSIKKQYIKYTEDKWRSNKLHPFQKAFLEDDLEELNILEAPTGAGKTYGFALLVASEVHKNVILTNKKVLIVSPTKILCQQIKNDIEKMYEMGEIKVQIVNSDELNNIGTHGLLDRWNTILEISNRQHFVIVTPDIINFIMTSSYQHLGNIDFSTSTVDFMNFFSTFTHIVIDEFHLYDPEQIANIFVWQRIFKVFNEKKAKLIFVSATPTNFVKEYLKEQNEYSIKFLKEDITEDFKNARAIHGNLDVTLLSSDNFTYQSLFEIIENENIIKKWNINKDEKLLCIYNSLKGLHLDKKKFENIYVDLKTAEISGYDKSYIKDENIILNSNILLGTSAIEQGVNIKVKNAVILAGFSVENLIQRFGRISRGDYDGNIIVIIPTNILEKLSDLDNKNLTINDFYNALHAAYNSLFQIDPNLINYFIGAFWYQVISRIGNRHLKNSLIEIYKSERKETKKFYKLLYSLKKSIDSIKNYKNRKDIQKELSFSYEKFLETFRYFRGSGTESINVYDVDSKITTEYAKDWIIKNKEILENTLDDGTLKVTNKSDDTPVNIQYKISSIPSCNNVLCTINEKDVSFNPKETFKKFLNNYFFERDFESRAKNESDPKLLLNIQQKWLLFLPIINSKRFYIEDFTIKDNSFVI